MLKIGICGLSVVTAAILGIRTGSRIPERLKAYMMSVLSILCFIVAITSIQKYADLLPVALALICGGILGGAANLSERISQLAWSVTGKMKGFKPGGAIKEEDFRKDFASIFSIVCLSGAGIMGSLIAGLSTGAGFGYMVLLGNENGRRHARPIILATLAFAIIGGIITHFLFPF